MIQKKGTWASYLAELREQKKEWRDPAILMDAFNITERAAKQIIARFARECGEVVE